MSTEVIEVMIGALLVVVVVGWMIKRKSDKKRIVENGNFINPAVQPKSEADLRQEWANKDK